MLEVAVIGAGASALAASRHLIREGLRPSVFEASKTLGGAWATNNSKMWGGLTTNLSKHTCRFSEWPWPDDAPTFPSAADMGRYLDGYAANFLDPTCVQYQCQVTNIEALGSGTTSGYRVDWTDLSTFQQHSKEFEGVIVATGFFSKPHFPAGFDRTNPKIQNHRVLHSSEYQSPMDFVNQTVAVIGSSFSALEIAVEIATTATRVVHVVPRIPWVLPRYVPAKVEQQQQPNSPTSITTAGTSILPVDLALYRRTQDAPQLPELRDMSPDTCRSRHEFLHSIIGKRQANTPLGIPPNWDEPPMVAISDYYLDMIVQGNVQVLHGRFVGLVDDSDHDNDGASDTGDSQSEAKPTWQVETPTGQPVYLKDVDRVICATGFESSLSDFLHPDILHTLEYDSTDTFCPMTCCWETLHPKLVNLFFCGMYRGPYMGIMELQGRLAAKALSGNLQLDQDTMNQALEESRQMRALHKAFRPQFPHFDYLGFMDTLNGLQSNDFPTTNVKQGDMVSPAFYQSTDKALAQDEVTALEEQVSRGRDGSRIPAIVLSAIIGEWNFDRRIVHFTDNRQEHVYGTVKYSRPILDHVLYREDGLYELSSTKTLTVFREYEYQVTGDCLEVYFVELGQRAHMFLSLKFTEQQGNRWVATSDHLCIKDLYQARFEIWLDGLAATHLQITYRVKGPSKDYESTTILTPKTTNLSVGRI